MEDESLSSADSYESLGSPRLGGPEEMLLKPNTRRKKKKSMRLLKAHGVPGADSCRYCKLAE